MSRRRGIVIAGGLALAGVLAFSGYRWRDANADGQRAVLAEQRRRQAEVELRNVEQSADAMETKLAHLRTAAAKATSAPPATAATPTSNPRPPARPSIADRLRTEPETQALWVKSRRHEVAAKYGPLLRTLNRSQEDQVRFGDVALRRDEKQMDIQAAATTQGLKPDDPVLQKLRHEAQRDYESDARALLGEDDFRALKEFERFSIVREMVDGVVGGSVLVARDPLTKHQAEQLIQVMANASERFRNGGFATGSDLNWDQIDAQARAILTPAQFALFTQMEPPLPLGARFQARLYQKVDEAKRSDTAPR